MALLQRQSLPVQRLALSLVAVGLVALLASGCLRILEPRQSDITYYLLDGSPGVDTVTSESDGLDVGLRQPRLASYLDAARIVRRSGTNEIDFSEFHRWGENLSSAINRVVALNLKNQSGVRSTETVPFSEASTFDYIVQLHVLRFEGRGPAPPGPEVDSDAPVPTGSSQMIIRWTVYERDGQTVVAQGTSRDTREDWPVTDYQALVSRLDASLEVVAEDIANRLRSLDRAA